MGKIEKSCAVWAVQYLTGASDERVFAAFEVAAKRWTSQRGGFPIPIAAAAWGIIAGQPSFIDDLATYRRDFSRKTFAEFIGEPRGDCLLGVSMDLGRHAIALVDGKVRDCLGRHYLSETVLLCARLGDKNAIAEKWT